MVHSDQSRWNERYLNRGPAAFGLEPSDWLREHEDLLLRQARGPALDLACGNGRNAIYLARLGYEVEAVDIADVAINWLDEHAREEGLSIAARVGDLGREPLPEQCFSVILNFNFLERRLFAAIEAALAPGGLVFFETFNTEQIDVLGSDIARRYVLEPNELLRSFPSLHVLRYREGVFYEHGRDRTRAVASLVARKVTG